jgi:hypothetical protein
MSNTLAIGVQDKEYFSKDKLSLIFQELNIGWQMELYQPSKYKNSFLFGTFFQHLGITKVNNLFYFIET